MQSFHKISDLPDEYRAPDRKYKILFLADIDNPSHVVNSHIDGIAELSHHDIEIVNCRFVKLLEAYQNGALIQCDAILIHYSIHALAYIDEQWTQFIASFPGAVIAIHEDEYQNIDEFTNKFAKLGVNHLVSCLSSIDLLKQVYLGRVGDECCFYHSLPGYINHEFDQSPPPALIEREFDIVYRGRELPYQLGAFAQTKKTIGEKMREAAGEKGLKLDISSKEDDRIYGDDWRKFLQKGKAVLGTEGGASIFDFDGSIKTKTDAFLQSDDDPTYEKAHELFLHEYEGNVIYKTLTPKIFEYTANKTIMVLHPGAYGGYIEPDKHYLMLHEDFSNIEDVLERLQNLDEMQHMVDRAYDHIKGFKELRFDFYVGQLDKIISYACQQSPVAEFFKSKNQVNLSERYHLFQQNLFERIVKPAETSDVEQSLFSPIIEGVMRENKTLQQKNLELAAGLNQSEKKITLQEEKINKLENENEKLSLQVQLIMDKLDTHYRIKNNSLIVKILRKVGIYLSSFILIFVFSGVLEFVSF